jgi:hypothetical protein
MQQIIRQRRGTLRLILYTILIFVVLVGTGEALSRSLFGRQLATVNSFESSNYGPASENFEHIQRFTAEHGDPDCMFFGSSLVKRGFNPDVFERAYQAKTGERLSCYNFGMDGASISTSSLMALIMARQYKPKYVFVSLNANEFTIRSSLDSLAEEEFAAAHWGKFALHEFNLASWLMDNSVLYRLVEHYTFHLFPVQRTPTTAPNNLRPQAAEMWFSNGYGPHVAYRDDAPLFTAPDVPDTTKPLKRRNVNDFQQLIQIAQSEHIPLIVVELPTPDQPPPDDPRLELLRSFTRQHGIPVLSLRNMPPLPANAYCDVMHLHIIGSFVLSDWLGNQIGQAAAAGVLAKPDDPLWSPALDQWPTSVYTATLGLGESRYGRYLDEVKRFDLVEPDAVIFNPSAAALDGTFAQSLIGLEIEWEGIHYERERGRLFQLMVVLGKMRYQDELGLSASQAAQLDEWRTTLDPAIPGRLGIHYILCRMELANPAAAHCPAGIVTNPAYLPVGDWPFSPLHEQYSLYRVRLLTDF